MGVFLGVYPLTLPSRTTLPAFCCCNLPQPGAACYKLVQLGAAGCSLIDWLGLQGSFGLWGQVVWWGLGPIWAGRLAVYVLCDVVAQKVVGQVSSMCLLSNSSVLPLITVGVHLHWIYRWGSRSPSMQSILLANYLFIIFAYAWTDPNNIHHHFHSCHFSYCYWTFTIFHQSTFHRIFASGVRRGIMIYHF